MRLATRSAPFQNSRASNPQHARKMHDLKLLNRQIRACCLALAALVCAAAQANELLFSSTASGSMQLHVLNEAAKSTRALTSSPGDNDNAVWAPDGRRIAFVSTRDGRPQVYVMNADGTAQQRLSGPGDFGQSPAWSADSRSLAYTSHRDGKHGLYTQVLGTAQEHLVLTAIGGVSSLVWSPNGEKLAFATSTGVRKGNVLIADLRTGSTVPLALEEGASNFRPVWSPDGGRLAYVASAGRTGINVFTCKSDGSDVKAVTKTIYSSAAPVWSPDGKTLAFTSNLETGERSEIFVADVASGNVRNLTQHEHEDIEPAWAADSRSIYFVSFRSGTSQLYRAALDGTTQRVSLAAHYESTPLPRPVTAPSVTAAATQDHPANRPIRKE